MTPDMLKRISDFLARVPGLPIMIAIGLVLSNFVLQLLPPWPMVDWLAHTNFLLHLALISGFLGVLLGEAL